MYKLLPGLLLILLVGCGTQHIQDKNGRWIAVAPGSQVETLRPIRLPLARSRIFIQRGQVISLGNLDAYHPSCNFEIRFLGQADTTVQPDIFLIHSVEIGSESVVQLGGTDVAALTLQGFHDPGPSIHRFFRFRLVSGEQPDVLSLTCRGALNDQWESRLPDLDQIREVLGGIARIELNEE